MWLFGRAPGVHRRNFGPVLLARPGTTMRRRTSRTGTGAGLGFRWEQRRGRGHQHGREPASGCGYIGEEEALRQAGHRMRRLGVAALWGRSPLHVYARPLPARSGRLCQVPGARERRDSRVVPVIGDYGRIWEAAGMAPPGTGQGCVSARLSAPSGPPRMPSPGSAPSRLRLIDLPGGRRHGRHNVMAAAQGDYHEVPGVPRTRTRRGSAPAPIGAPLTWTQPPGRPEPGHPRVFGNSVTARRAMDRVRPIPPTTP